MYIPQGVLWIGETSERQSSQRYQEFNFLNVIKRKRHTREELPTNAGGDDPCHIYYTSGTTGVAKGVVLSHNALLAHAMASVAEFQIQQQDRWLHLAPIFHVADAFAVLAITYVGGTHVMEQSFNPTHAWDTMSQQRITITNISPSMLTSMLHVVNVGTRFESSDFSELRMLSCGGASIPQATIEKFKQLNLFCSYVLLKNIFYESIKCKIIIYTVAKIIIKKSEMTKNK